MCAGLILNPAKYFPFNIWFNWQVCQGGFRVVGNRYVQYSQGYSLHIFLKEDNSNAKLFLFFFLNLFYISWAQTTGQNVVTSIHGRPSCSLFYHPQKTLVVTFVSTSMGKDTLGRIQKADCGKGLLQDRGLSLPWSQREGTGEEQGC